MRKKTIVIASVLKPVNDTRMYEKMALSLSKANKYDINIIGFSTKSITKEKHISFYPIFNFERLTWERALASITYYHKLNVLAPDLIIINTHELLIPTIIYKWFHPAKLIYDVRENHFRNIMFTKSFPFPFRPILAIWVRSKEYLSSLWIDHFFLAEKHYKKEIHFVKKKLTVLENKAIIPTQITSEQLKNSKIIQILFSGTLAESTGVFEAVKLVQKLHKLEPKIRLIIIGYSPKTTVINDINLAIKNSNYISLIGGQTLVDHDQILKEIWRSDFGIIIYPSNKSTINSTPTKLYEYLSNQLPILIQKHHNWDGICASYQAGITIDLANIDTKSLLEKMNNLVFYPDGVGEEFLWTSEEKKLLDCVNIITQ